MHINRYLKPKIESVLGKSKIIILYGARQVGKTTLVKEILAGYTGKSRYLNCDEPDIREALTRKTSTEMKSFIGDGQLVVLDEAQRVPDIGLSLKLLHDTYPDLTIIATGLSSFELSNSVSEPLTGRNESFTLHPISFSEYAASIGTIEASRLLEERIRFGSYPAVIAAPLPENEARSLARDYLLRDVLRIETIRKPMVVEKLVKLLALQVGQQVSYNELAQQLEVSRQTVMGYVRLLEQAFVIFRLPPLGKNKRKEVTRFDKIYFYDTGIRNALIDDFKPLEYRADKGHLFENFFIAERVKQLDRQDNRATLYYWRTKTGAEIDLVEDAQGTLRAFECKWAGEAPYSRAWLSEFPGTLPTIVTRKSAPTLLLQ
ncbi:MAG: putative AAA+ superfamily ATPase [Parcubacteria group bacterium Gr01-1014_8]|nr:MAG: putative AAA+ superfamily ATPase [Parcubacteria group bacterium Gr01-1014_8]